MKWFPKFGTELSLPVACACLISLSLYAANPPSNYACSYQGGTDQWREAQALLNEITTVDLGNTGYEVTFNNYDGTLFTTIQEKTASNPLLMTSSEGFFSMRQENLQFAIQCRPVK